MKKVKVVIIGLGSRGLHAYADCVRDFPDKMEIAAVADIRPEMVELAQRLYDIPADRCYDSGEALLSQGKLGDAAFVCTQDRQHYAHASAALRLGYDVLLEKPITPEPEELRELVELAETLHRRVSVCHVLRYTPFYGELKRLLDEGAVGEVVSVQHIENVVYWHQAHSFVRGNWRSEAETSPMILAKCCHDTDLLVWLTGRRAARVSSFGGLYEFRPERAPAGSGERCTECAVRESCPFDAEKIYLTNPGTGVLRGNRGWPVDVLTPEPDEASVRRAIETGPYGRCVYRCDNDVVDHQVVNIEFEGGATAQLTMSAFTKRGGRDTVIMGTRGQIVANLSEQIIRVCPFDGERQEIDVRKLSSDLRGHSGGDTRLVEEFLDLVSGEAGETVRTTTLSASAESHYIAFAAERSRVEDGRAVDMKEFRS